MKTNKIIFALSSLYAAFATNAADALQYSADRFALKLTGYGDLAMIEPEFKDPLITGDWKLRGQANYAVAAGQTMGMVYSIDAQRTRRHRYMTDLFALFEDRSVGRIELGLTESIAAKLGLGLPDVGGLRMNDNPLFYDRISPRGAVVADTTLDSGTQALRINLASSPTNTVQYGLSASGVTDDYKFAVDAAAKIRRPSGKVKTAYSVGASFMDSPENFYQDPYSALVTADWRAQGTLGFNLQYNSVIWGVTLRGIYDENPIGVASDGIAAGTGISYDLMQYSFSLSYMFSETGIWHDYTPDYADHTVLGSLRYKYSENVTGWMSLGSTTKTPFVAAGIRLSF